MNKESIEKYLDRFPGAESSFPFGAEALVYKIMGKMFALVSQEEEVPRVTLKCNPADGLVLTDQFASITPGYHMNKKHWITISLTGEIPEEMMCDLARNSYDLVVNKLPKRDQKKIKDMEIP